MKFIFLNYIDEIPTEWNDFLPDNNFLKTQNLIIFDQKDQKNNLKNVFMMMRNSDEILGLYYFQLINATIKDFKKIFPKNNLTFGEDISANILVLGNIFHSESDCYFIKQDITDIDHQVLLLSAINKAQKETNALIFCLKDRNINLNNITAINSDFGMTIKIDPEWKNFDQYHQSLKRKYRSRIDKILESKEKLNFEFLTFTETQNINDEIYQLYLQVLNSTEFGLVKLPQNYFTNLIISTYVKVEIIGIYIQKKLVGFISGIITDDSYEIHYIGFDVKLNKELSLYQNIQLLGLERAIELQKNNYKLGRTAVESKAMLGAEPEFYHHQMIIKNRTLKTKVTEYLNTFFENQLNLAKSRSPFS